MKKQNIEPQNFANTGPKFLKKLDKLIDILTKSVETNNENDLQRDLQLEIFDFEKILNDEILMYNQASLNIDGYCLQKLKDSNIELYKNNNIEEIIKQLGNNLNDIFK
jgi:hypothetical protein